MNNICKILLNIKSTKNLSSLLSSTFSSFIDIITNLDNTFGESNMIK